MNDELEKKVFQDSNGFYNPNRPTLNFYNPSSPDLKFYEPNNPKINFTPQQTQKL